MKRLALAPFLLLFFVSAASAQTAAPAQALGPRMDGYPSVGAPPTVTMLATGSAPKSLLRLAIPATCKERMDATTTMSMGMEMAGMSMPAMTLPGMKFQSEVAVTGVSPNGDVTYSMKFKKMTVPTESGVDPAIVAAMRAADGQMSTITGSTTISNRGITLDASMDMSKTTDPQITQMFGGASEAMWNLTIPLPEEAVGVGARWETRQAITSSGMTIFQKTEFELVAVDGQVVALRSKVEQSAPPQAISMPTLPPGTEAELQSLVGTGSSTLTLRLNGLVPTSEATIQSKMTMRIAMGGESQIMATTLDLKATIALAK